MEYKHSDAGKGAQDRSSTRARSASPLWKQVRLTNGINLEPEEAAAALNEINYLLADFLEDDTITEENKIQIQAWVAKHYKKQK